MFEEPPRPVDGCPGSYQDQAGATVEFGAASLEAEITIDYSAFRSEFVPEPESLGLMLLGIIGLPLIRRRRPQ